MGNLFEELDAIASNRGPVCGVDTLLRVLSPKESDELRTALTLEAGPGVWKYRASDIARLMEKRGHPIQPETLQRHRRGSCRCQSPTS